MSVVGIVTIFKCDGEGCQKWKGVNIEHELEAFESEWFVGAEIHFCDTCKIKLENQSAIAQHEFDMDAMTARITSGVMLAKEVANVH